MSVANIKLHDSQQFLIDCIQNGVANMQSKGIKVNMYWIPGHADLLPNELADQAAKDAANDSVELSDQNLSEKLACPDDVLTNSVM